MKKTIIILAACILSLPFAFAATAEEMGHHGHSKDMDHMGYDKHHMDQSGHMGEIIHNSTVDGYQFVYHLIDMREKMAAMKGMKGMNMEMTHHLMVYLVGPDGKKVHQAKIGYIVEGPDNNKQKCMTMAMADGYGADVNLKGKGMYTIKTKVVTDGKKIVDSFMYHKE